MITVRQAVFCVKAFTCMYFNELVCWGGGGLHTKILNNTQWQRHTGNCYFILHLDHMGVAYSAANIHAVAHVTF